MRVKKAIILLIVSIPIYAMSQVKTTMLDKKDLPQGIQYEGNVETAISYTDKLGENIVFTTIKNKVYEDEEIGIGETVEDIELYSYHYVVEEGKGKFISRVYDFEKNCIFDIRGKFIGNTPLITDLNHDGIAEIWVMYSVGCTSDVSGGTMKIIMYSNKKKYAMRGRYMVETLDWSDGGEYKFDSAFNNAPQEFRDYAKQLWNSNIMGD